MKAPVLESKRLLYRPLNTDFVSEAYVNWMNDETVNRYLESGGDYTIDKLKRFLTEVEKKDILFWAILLKDGEKHIGNIKIDPISTRNKVGEYGILIGDKSTWGKGLAKEASQRIIDFCFSDQLNLRKVTLGVVCDNIAAYKLYQKLGFETEGILKRHTYHEDKWCDVARMAIFNPSLDV